MAITFSPKRGAILMCDFDMSFVEPEMRKKRQVAVISIASNNYRHGALPGTCTIIPFSTVEPKTVDPDDIFFPLGSYWSLTVPCWARCKLITTVSHARLDLVLRNGRRHPSEFLRSEHMDEIAKGISYSLGF